MDEFTNALEQKIIQVTTPLPGATPAAIEYKLTVKLKSAGKTLLDFYLQTLPHISIHHWKKALQEGRILVDGAIGKAEQVLREGQITSHFSLPVKEPEVANNIEVLFESSTMLVVNKPAPLPVHPGGRFYRNTLIAFLRKAAPETAWKLVHRLDSNTTGVLMLAKTTEKAAYISQQFKDLLVKKYYLALVHGMVEKDQFISSKPVGKSKIESGKRSLEENGLEATTLFRVLKRNKEQNETLLLVEPQTGRTNQIRLHLNDFGYPIVGDLGYSEKYYEGEKPLSYVSDCLFLHAFKIEIFNQETGVIDYFKADIPQKFLDKGYVDMD